MSQWGPNAGKVYLVNTSSAAAGQQHQQPLYSHDNSAINYKANSPEGRISPTYAKQALAKKLLHRRSMEQLRQQNFTSGLSPSFHDNRARLQRAQTQDFLSKKLNARPDATQLVYSNILRRGQSSNSRAEYVDPSLVSRQEELVKAKIGDEIRHHLETRPGPLDLVQNNIMQLNEGLNNVIKSGAVNFESNEGGNNANRHPSFQNYREAFSPESRWDSFDSLSIQASPENVLSPESNYSVTSPERIEQDQYGEGIEHVYSEKVEPLYNNIEPSERRRDNELHNIRGSPKIKRKHNKSKVKKFKYHEYKPPGAKDKDDKPGEGGNTSETPYKIILKQQQLLLQLQVMQQNYPNYALPNTVQLLNELKDVTSQSRHLLSAGNLADMKVSKLKEELKKRHLPTSGTKTMLMERLKPYIDPGIGAPLNKETPVLHRSSSEGDILEGEQGNMLRKNSQPVMSLNDIFNNSMSNNAVNSSEGNNRSDENRSIVEYLSSMMVRGDEHPANRQGREYSASPGSRDYPSPRQERSVSNESGPPPPYPGTSPRQDGSPYSMDQQASTMDGTYCQLLASSPTNYPSIPISIMAPQDGNDGSYSNSRNPSIAEASPSMSPMSGSPNNVSHMEIPQHMVQQGQYQGYQQYQPGQQQQQQYSVYNKNVAQQPVQQQQQEMLPIPAMGTNLQNTFYNVQQNYRTAQQPQQQQQQIIVQQQAPQQQYIMVPQQQFNMAQQPQQQQQQQSMATGEYAAVPTEAFNQTPFTQQYVTTNSMQQLRCAQLPRHTQQQLHQQRLNEQVSQQQKQQTEQRVSRDSGDQFLAQPETPRNLTFRCLGPRETKPSISTPDVINVLLQTPNTPQDRKDPPGSFAKKPLNRSNNSMEMDAMYEVLKRQDDYDSEMDTTPDPRGYDPRHTLGHQMSEDWLSANMPQDLLTPDTANLSKLTTPGGESVFEFTQADILNNV